MEYVGRTLDSKADWEHTLKSLLNSNKAGIHLLFRQQKLSNTIEPELSELFVVLFFIVGEDTPIGLGQLARASCPSAKATIFRHSGNDECQI